jgi:hypothetical protein
MSRKHRRQHIHTTAARRTAACVGRTCARGATLRLSAVVVTEHDRVWDLLRSSGSGGHSLLLINRMEASTELGRLVMGLTSSARVRRAERLRGSSTMPAVT